MGRNSKGALWLIAFVLLIVGGIKGQLQQSGGGGSSVTLQSGSNIAGKFGIDQTTPGTTNLVAAGQNGTWTVQPGNTANTTAWKVDGSAVTQPVTGTLTAVTSITNALPAGTNLIGFIKQRPAGCTTALTSDVIHDTVGVATGAGTSVSSVTGCVLECFINNITNSAVTFRLADKTGTPIIWIGGNGDFSLPANSNLGCGGNGGLNIAGITFTSGITAIAGTASALNLHLVTRE